jgi:hypothetical protein
VSVARRPLVAWRHTGLEEKDVFLAHYPKSGGTWLRMMLTEGLLDSEVGFAAAADSVPPVGSHRGAPAILPTGGRLIKTHESYRRSYRRAILLVRDVRDVLLSYFHYWRLRTDSEVELDPFIDRFVDGSLDGYRPWHVHNQSWLDAQNSGADLLVVRYEDLRQNPLDPLSRCFEFLGAEVAEQRMEDIVSHNSLDSMRTKEESERSFFDSRVRGTAAVGFVRRGATGDWQATLSPAQLAKLAPADPMLRRLGYPPIDV